MDQVGLGDTEDQRSAGKRSRADQSISPPPVRKRAAQSVASSETQEVPPQAASKVRLASPFRLNRVQDAEESANRGTVRLSDLIGDPLIKECWFFDYLYDVDWLMKHFDSDVRHLVNVKIVHGSWRSDDPNKMMIDEAASRYSNVNVITAYMPEAFGTHHSKMIVLFRHDEQAQVIIHTANMIERDWKNMTQGLWLSPMLPFLAAERSRGDSHGPLGSGIRFKHDLRRYLTFYGPKRTGSLTEQLEQYDFSGVRAVLVASVPTRLSLGTSLDDDSLFGWPWLRHVLRHVPLVTTEKRSLVVAQVSSIAYLGEEWIGHFLETLSIISPSECEPSMRPKCRVMFPTTEEIRTCFDGYSAGGSIHMRIQSKQAQRQLAFLRPWLLKWSSPGSTRSAAGRERAAPHIKTFTRFGNQDAESVEWTMLTSANLSTQAWGSVAKNGEVRISSYEIGVLVWPSLLADDNDAVMVPTFQQDIPATRAEDQARATVGLRMPYSLPVEEYTREDEPWIATKVYDAPDIKGSVWPPEGVV